MVAFSEDYLFLRFGMLILNDTTFLLDEGAKEPRVQKLYTFRA